MCRTDYGRRPVSRRTRYFHRRKMVFVEPAALNLPVSTSAPSSPRVLGKRLPQSQTPKRPYRLLEPDRRQHGRVSFWRRLYTGRECGQIVPPCIWPGFRKRSAGVRTNTANLRSTGATNGNTLGPSVPEIFSGVRGTSHACPHRASNRRARCARFLSIPASASVGFPETRL